MNQLVRILLISMALSTLLGLPIFGAANDFCSSESTRPNLLFLLDNSGSMMTNIRDANGNPTGQKRIDALREALLTMLENTHNVNVGLGRFAALIKKKPEVGVNVPIMFPVSYIDGMAREIVGEIDDTIMDVSVSIARSADDAVQNVGTGKMSLADAKLQLVTTTDEEPNGIKVERQITIYNNDGVEWLGDIQKNRLTVSDQILYLGTDPESEPTRNKGDSLIGLRFDKLKIPKGATIEFAEIEFVSDQEYEGELQLNIYGAANDGEKPTSEVTGDPSGIALGSSNFLNDAGNRYGYLSGEGYSSENFPKQNLTSWDLPPKVVANEVFNTPDISSIIQAIVDRDGWLDENSLVLLFERNSNSPVNTRGFYSYDGRAIGEPPLLRVYWSLQNATATAVSGVEADGSIFKSDHAAETKNTDKYSTKEIRLGKQRDTNLLGNGDETLVGIRFQNINIPKGSIISEANITFTHQSGSEQDEWGNKPLNLMVFGEKSADADYFGNSSIRPERKVSARPKTDAYVEWEEVENTDVGQQFGIIPNSSGGTISDILQEIIEQTDWRKGNDVVFLLERNGDTNTGFRRIVGTGDNYVKDGVISRWYDEATVDPNELVPFNPAEPDGEKIHKNLPRLEVTFSVGLPSDNVGPAENDKQIVGLRFEKVDIPNGAEIVSAHIEFTSGADAAEPTILVIKAEDVDDAKSFTDKPNNISERSTTSNQVYWNQEPWENGLTYQSPDISAVVQEVVDRDGWCGGRGGLAFIISGSSEEPLRVAKSYDNRPTEAPVLKVKFDSKKINGNGCVNQNFSGQIQAESDDAEQKLSGSEAGNVFLTSDTFELASRGSEARLVGFRFREIPLSSTVKVLSAHLVLNARSDKSGAANFKIYGEKSPSPYTFTNDANDLSKRPKTSAKVIWSLGDTPEDAWKSNQIYKSPNIGPVIQEIIEQEDWETYNDMALFIDGVGRRDVFSFKASPWASAILQIQVEGYLGESGEGDLMTVRRWLKKVVRKMEIPTSLTPIVDALYEATQYYRGEAVEFGRTRHGKYFYLISHPGTIDGYTEGMISRAEECKSNVNPFAEVCASEKYTAQVNYASPIKSSYQTNHIVLLSDGVATKHTSLESVQRLIDKTDCIGSYEYPDDPTKTIDVSKYEMCGIDLADFLSANDQVRKQPGTENTITIHTIGFQLGKAWRTVYTDASNDRRVYQIDGIYYYDEAGEEPVPERTRLEINGYEESVMGTATNARAVKFLQRLASVNTSDGTRNFYPAETVDDLVKVFNSITADSITACITDNDIPPPAPKPTLTPSTTPTGTIIITTPTDRPIVQFAGDGSGSVTASERSSGKFSCHSSETCPTQISIGWYKFEPTADQGSEFVQWRGQNCNNGEYTTTFGGTCIAVFKLLPPPQNPVDVTPPEPTVPDVTQPTLTAPPDATQPIPTAPTTPVTEPVQPVEVNYVGFSDQAYKATENAGSVDITVNRIGTTGEISVDLLSADDSGKADIHYRPIVQTLFWANGDDTEILVPVAIIDNSEVDGDKNVTLSLGNADKAELRVGTAILTIVDDDEKPQVVVKPEPTEPTPTVPVIIEEPVVIIPIIEEPIVIMPDESATPTTVTSGPSISGVACNTSGTINQSCNASGKTITDLEVSEVKEGSQMANVVLDAPLTNKGRLSNITVAPEGKVSGGIITGNAKNEGRMEDFEFVGATLSGVNAAGEVVGTLAGKVVNNSKVGGSFEDVRLAPEAHIIGGILAKRINGDSEKPATLEKLHIKTKSVISNVIIAENVTYGEGITFTNVEFRTKVVRKVILQGNINGTRFQETYTRVESVTIRANSHLSNLDIGDNVKFENGVTLDDSVTFSVHQRYMETHTIAVLPNLNGFAAIDIKGLTWARLQGGARFGAIGNRVERYRKKVTFKRSKRKNVKILGNVLTDVRHIGQKADILVAAAHTPLDATSPKFYMLDNHGTPLLWELDMSSLVPFQDGVTLTPVMPIQIWNNPLDILGDVQVYFGYRLVESGEIVHSLEDVIEMEFTE